MAIADWMIFLLTVEKERIWQIETRSGVVEAIMSDEFI
jgi:hypothetical protein